MNKNSDIISNILGDWGKWQFRSVFLIYLCKIPASWYMACIIFSAPSPRQAEFYCEPVSQSTISPIVSTISQTPTILIPNGLIATNNKSIKINKISTKWIKVQHPILVEENDRQFDVDFCDVYDDALMHAKLHKYEQNPWHEPHSNHTNLLPCKTFDHQPHYHTKLTIYDVFCSRNFVAALTQFFHLFGVLLGGIIATILLNFISPRRLMLIGMISQIVFGVTTAFVGHFKLHLFLRMMCAICCAQMFTAGQVIFTDITGGKYRATVLCLYENFWSIGVILLSGIAYTVETFTNIYLAITLPTCFYIILWFWIPDSPRWLLSKGLMDEAKKVIIYGATLNGTTRRIPLNFNDKLHYTGMSNANQNKSASWTSLWSTKKLMVKMLALHIAWSVCVSLFNGMLLNVRAFGKEFLYTNIVIAGFSEMIGVTVALILILNTSRKWMWTGLYNILAGFLVVSTWFIPSTVLAQNTTVLMIFAMFTKSAISCSQAMLVTCTSELIAPEQRKICQFSCIVWARICLLSAPFVGSLTLIHTILPLTIFGLLGALGGFAICVMQSPRTIPKVINIENFEIRQDLDTEMQAMILLKEMK